MQTTSFLLLASALVFGQACSKDDDAKNPTVLGTGGSNAGSAGVAGASGTSKGGSGGKASTGSGGAATVGGTAQGGESPEGGAPAAEGGRSPASGGTGGQVTEQGGEGGVAPVGGDCFSKPKSTPDSLQFLNRCTDSRCSPFDNFQRIPGFNGTLPPL